jgi:hypothetical protein
MSYHNARKVKLHMHANGYNTMEVTQAVENELLCAGYSHYYQSFHAHPQVHDWWLPNGNFLNEPHSTVFMFGFGCLQKFSYIL